MTPLKEMYERLAELKAKEKRYSEEEAEILELNNSIALREKYLQRYINHPPHMKERILTVLQTNYLHEAFNAETRAAISNAISMEVNNMVALGQVFGRVDRDDLVFYLDKELVIK